MTRVDFANDAQKRYAAIVVAITTVTLVLVQGDYVGIFHVLGDVILLPAQTEEQDGLLPMLQNFRRDTVLPWCLATGETADGYAELFQCWHVVKLLYDWQPRQGIEGSVSDNVLGSVELEIMLHPVLQLHALISGDLTSL